MSAGVRGSVLAAFYEFRRLSGSGPMVARSGTGGRVDAHHNPMEPFRLPLRGAYWQKQPDRLPRAVPDDVIDDLFASLGCHRARALVAVFLSSGARAAEMLGMTVADAHPGDGRIWVRIKGLGGIKQACPASPEAFGWLRCCPRPASPPRNFPRSSTGESAAPARRSFGWPRRC